MWPQYPSLGALCLALQAQVQTFGPKLLQLLAEWKTFPQDFQEGSTIQHIRTWWAASPPVTRWARPGVLLPAYTLIPGT